MSPNRQIDITSFELSAPMWELGGTKISFYIEVNFDPDKYFGIDEDTFDCIDDAEEYKENPYVDFYVIYDVDTGAITGNYEIKGFTWIIGKNWEFTPEEKSALLRAMNECTMRESGVDLQEWIRKFQ